LKSSYHWKPSTFAIQPILWRERPPMKAKLHFARRASPRRTSGGSSVLWSRDAKSPRHVFCEVASGGLFTGPDRHEPETTESVPFHGAAKVAPEHQQAAVNVLVAAFRTSFQGNAVTSNCITTTQWTCHAPRSCARGFHNPPANKRRTTFV